jgi:hypothetical protein
MRNAITARHQDAKAMKPVQGKEHPALNAERRDTSRIPEHANSSPKRERHVK